jgi:hypothetical protein
MMPSWIEKILEGMGISGAIIFVLLTTMSGLIAYVRSLQVKADKVYGYRLQERDTLNKALTDAAKVLADMLEATEDRNDLTEEQAKLIEKQSQAFELLKVTVLAQYDNIRDHNNVAAQAVSALAEAVRTLTMMMTENRQIAAGLAGDVSRDIVTLSGEIRAAIASASQAQIVEMRSLLGSTTIVQRRRKITK